MVLPDPPKVRKSFLRSYQSLTLKPCTTNICDKLQYQCTLCDIHHTLHIFNKIISKYTSCNNKIRKCTVCDKKLFKCICCNKICFKFTQNVFIVIKYFRMNMF